MNPAFFVDLSSMIAMHFPFSAALRILWSDDRVDAVGRDGRVEGDLLQVVDALLLGDAGGVVPICNRRVRIGTMRVSGAP